MTLIISGKRPRFGLPDRVLLNLTRELLYASYELRSFLVQSSQPQSPIAREELGTIASHIEWQLILSLIHI